MLLTESLKFAAVSNRRADLQEQTSPTNIGNQQLCLLVVHVVVGFCNLPFFFPPHSCSHHDFPGNPTSTRKIN